MLERGGGVYGDNAIIYSDLAIAIACFAFLPASESKNTFFFIFSQFSRAKAEPRCGK